MREEVEGKEGIEEIEDPEDPEDSEESKEFKDRRQYLVTRNSELVTTFTIINYQFTFPTTNTL